MICGVAIALAETFVNYVGGGVTPWHVLATLVAGYAVAGAVYGALLGLVTARWEPSRAAVVAAAVFGYGLLRIYEPSGWKAEPAFLVLCLGLFGVLRGLRLCDRSSPGSRGTAECLTLALGAIVAGTFIVEEVFERDLKGAQPLVLLVLLPAVVLAVHRGIIALVRRPAVVVLAEVAVAIGAALFSAHPAVLQPLTAPEATAATTGTSPNVVLISLDTVRADHLSVYGYGRPTAPHLEALARESRLFRNCYSTAGWTLPSHASMFTGLFPRTHGARLAGEYLHQTDPRGKPMVAYPLATDHETLAEILHAHGYATGAIIANFSYLFRDFGLARGFEYYDDAPAFLFRYRPHLVRFVERFSPSFLLKPYRRAEDINHTALEWVGQHPGRPFFLFVNYMEAHHPWIAPPPFDGWARSAPVLPQSHLDLYVHEARTFSPTEQTTLAAHYDGALAYIDEQVGRLLDELRRRNLYDDTLVIVVGDHGELLGEHGMIGHMGRVLYDGLVHVPLLIKYPRGGPTGVVSRPVQVVDLMPTVLDAVGLPVPAEVQGQVLPDVTHEIVVEEFINRRLAEHYGKRYDREQRALYRDGYELISTSQGDVELYKLDTDPREEHNLATAEAGVVQQYVAQLAAWETAHPVEIARRDGTAVGETAARLKALGYLQ